MGNLFSNWFNSPNMGQPVSEVHVMERQLRGGSGGLLSELFGVKHRAALVKTSNGSEYLIEKGVSKDDDSNFKRRLRKGECRIVQTDANELNKGNSWSLVESLTDVTDGLTLRDLFAACGEEYSLLSDNCQHGVKRMLDRARRKWYERYRHWILMLLLCFILWTFHPALPAAVGGTVLGVKALRRFVEAKQIHWLIVFVPMLLVSASVFQRQPLAN